MTQENKPLTTVELLHHIADNIEKNDGWVNDLEFLGCFGEWMESENSFDGMMIAIIDNDLQYRIKQEVTYSVGDRFIADNSGDEYILAQPEERMLCLICLNDGCRWKDAVKVKNAVKVTESEFEVICGCCTFTKLEKNV